MSFRISHERTKANLCVKRTNGVHMSMNVRLLKWQKEPEQPWGRTVTFPHECWNSSVEIFLNPSLIFQIINMAYTNRKNGNHQDYVFGWVKMEMIHLSFIAHFPYLDKCWFLEIIDARQVCKQWFHFAVVHNTTVCLESLLSCSTSRRKPLRKMNFLCCNSCLTTITI